MVQTENKRKQTETNGTNRRAKSQKRVKERKNKMDKTKFKAMFQKADSYAELKAAIEQLTLQEVSDLIGAFDTLNNLTGLTLKQETFNAMLKQAYSSQVKKMELEQAIEKKVIQIARNQKKESDNNELRRFKVGQIYTARSIGDHNCIFSYKVVKRSEKSIWIENTKDQNPKVKRRVIEIYDNAEMVYPSGKYSMAHSIRA